MKTLTIPLQEILSWQPPKQWIVCPSFLRVDRSDGSGLFRSGWIPVRYVGGAPNGNDLVVPQANAMLGKQVTGRLLGRAEGEHWQLVAQATKHVYIHLHPSTCTYIYIHGHYFQYMKRIEKHLRQGWLLMKVFGQSCQSKREAFEDWNTDETNLVTPRTTIFYSNL